MIQLGEIRLKKIFLTPRGAWGSIFKGGGCPGAISMKTLNCPHDPPIKVAPAPSGGTKYFFQPNYI